MAFPSIQDLEDSDVPYLSDDDEPIQRYEKTEVVPEGCCKWCARCKAAYDKQLVNFQDDADADTPSLSDISSRTSYDAAKEFQGPDGTRFFEKMPQEILSMIFSECDFKDLKTLRLINKAFAATLGPRIFTKVHVKKTGAQKGIFKELVKIASSPHANLIKSLRIPFDMQHIVSADDPREEMKPEAWATLAWLLEKIETLKMYIINDGNVRSQRESNQELSGLVSSVRRLLSTIKSIKRLGLSLTRRSGLLSQCLSSFSFLNLESLDIGNVQTTNHALSEHLSGLLPGLRHLGLNFVLLRTGDWVSIFKQVAGAPELERFAFRSNNDGSHRDRHLVAFENAFGGQQEIRRVLHGYEIVWHKFRMRPDADGDDIYMRGVIGRKRRGC